MICERCGGPGHEKSTCFKLHGVPEWYQDLKDKRTKSFANMTSYATNDSQQGFNDTRRPERGSEFSAILQQLTEMTKFMKGKENQPAPNQDFALFVIFAGTTFAKPFNFAFSTLAALSNDTWIIDTEAGRHMCTNLILMQNLSAHQGVVTVCLPDGSVKHVEFSGDVHLSSDIILKDVLYMSSFKYNLLSVI